MKTVYNEEYLIQLSSIQHFEACRRQWALMYVENQWLDNSLTIEGKVMHDRVDRPFEDASRKGVRFHYAMPVCSYTLGITGVCDLVEFHACKEGIILRGSPGTWEPIPIEYKRGKPKQDLCDEVQVCAQAMCLEEMLCTYIPRAYIYYGQTRHRTPVELTNELRSHVISICQEMHQYLKRGYTPKVRKNTKCKGCSLQEICLPDVQARSSTVHSYIAGKLEEDT